MLELHQREKLERVIKNTDKRWVKEIIQSSIQKSGDDTIMQEHISYCFTLLGVPTNMTFKERVCYYQLLGDKS